MPNGPNLTENVHMFDQTIHCQMVIPNRQKKKKKNAATTTKQSEGKEALKTKDTHI